MTSIDWASHPILQHPDVPEVVIDLVERQAEKPWGAGRSAGLPFTIGETLSNV